MNLSRRALLRTLGLSSAFAAIQFPPRRSLGDLFFNGARGEAPTRPIRLDNNEDLYGPSPRAADAMLDALNAANRYRLRKQL